MQEREKPSYRLGQKRRYGVPSLGITGALPSLCGRHPSYKRLGTETSREWTAVERILELSEYEAPNSE